MPPTVIQGHTGPKAAYTDYCSNVVAATSESRGLPPDLLLVAHQFYNFLYLRTLDKRSLNQVAVVLSLHVVENERTYPLTKEVDKTRTAVKQLLNRETRTRSTSVDDQVEAFPRHWDQANTGSNKEIKTVQKDLVERLRPILCNNTFFVHWYLSTQDNPSETVQYILVRCKLTRLPDLVEVGSHLSQTDALVIKAKSLEFFKPSEHKDESLPPPGSGAGEEPEGQARSEGQELTASIPIDTDQRLVDKEGQEHCAFSPEVDGKEPCAGIPLDVGQEGEQDASTPEERQVHRADEASHSAGEVSPKSRGSTSKSKPPPELFKTTLCSQDKLINKLRDDRRRKMSPIKGKGRAFDEQLRENLQASVDRSSSAPSINPEPQQPRFTQEDVQMIALIVKEAIKDSSLIDDALAKRDSYWMEAKRAEREQAAGLNDKNSAKSKDPNSKGQDPTQLVKSVEQANKPLRLSTKSKSKSKTREKSKSKSASRRKNKDDSSSSSSSSDEPSDSSDSNRDNDSSASSTSSDNSKEKRKSKSKSKSKSRHPKDGDSEDNDDSSEDDTRQRRARKMKQLKKRRHFNPEKWGFFDPHLDSAYGQGDIVTVGAVTGWRSVTMFIEAIKGVLRMHSSTEIRASLSKCLRGEAATWYQYLSERKKDKLFEGKGADNWIAALLKRFKPSSSKAYQELSANHFTIDSVRQGLDISEWADRIVRLSKETGAETRSSHLSAIYTRLDPKLQITVDAPEENMSLNRFIRSLQSKQVAWRGLYKGNEINRFASSVPSSSSTYTSQFQGPYASQARFTGQGSPFYNRFKGQDYSQGYRAPYQPYGQGYSQIYSQNNQISKPLVPAKPPQFAQRSPLSNTSGNDRANLQTQSSVTKKEVWRPTTQANQYRPSGLPFQGRQTSYAPQRGYAYQVDDGEHDNQEADQENQGQEQEMENGQVEFEQGQIDETFDVTAAYYINEKTGPRLSKRAIPVPSSCDYCYANFGSRNKLFKHFRLNTCGRKVATTSLVQTNVINSQIKPCSEQDRKEYSYVFSKAQSTLHNPSFTICLDSGCSQSTISRVVLERMWPDVKPYKAVNAAVLDTAYGKMTCEDRAKYTIYLPGFRVDKTPAVAEIEVDTWVIDKLSPNMLLGVDVLQPNGIDIVITDCVAKIKACEDMTIPITLKKQWNLSKTKVQVKENQFVPAHTRKFVNVKPSKPLASGSSFLFEPLISSLPDDKEPTILSHLADETLHGVWVINDSSFPKRFSKNQTIGTLEHAHVNGAYIVTEASQEYIHGAYSLVDPNEDMQPQEPEPQTSQVDQGEQSVAMPPESEDLLIEESSPFQDDSQGNTDRNDHVFSKVSPPRSDRTTILDNGVTVYGDESTVEKVKTLVEKHTRLFTDKQSTIDLPEDQHMTVDLRPDWMDERLTTRPYPIGAKDKQAVDDLFNGLQEQGKMSWSTKATPFGFPVFVTYRKIPIPGTDEFITKARPVVDIRGLNKLTIKDSYPLPLQSDLIAKLRNKNYISIVDAVTFFYQWQVAEEDRHKFTVNTHRGQEQFNVAVMGFRNSVQYVQRQLDKILREFEYAMAFIDDICIFSDDLDSHLQHLDSVFTKLESMNFSISPKKSFLACQSAQLLGQKVDALGLSTTEERINAIRQIKYPETVQQLEKFLGMTGYLRHYIPYYAQLAEPLQKLKTEHLRDAPVGRGARRSYVSSRKPLDNDNLRLAFERLKNAVVEVNFLHHHDPSRNLYVDVDASKEYGFGVILYHVKGDPEPVMVDTQVQKVIDKSTGQTSVENLPQTWLKRAEQFSSTDVQPILFLSKSLSDTETRYWPTELEMAALVWAIKKTYHFVQASNKTYVFTDHSALAALTKGTNITTTAAVENLNLKIVRACQYLAQFDLDVRYRPGRHHLVPDALSRLPTNDIRDPEEDDILDSIFTVSLVELSPDFKTRIKLGYEDDKVWKQVILAYKSGQDVVDNKDGNKFLSGLPFQYKDGLLYRRQEDGSDRLCIPYSVVKEVFYMCHDDKFHSGFNRAYAYVRDNFYVHRLAAKLRSYIGHCPECLTTQTTRHKPYGYLQPIESSAIPFKTITMDWVVRLPPDKKGNDQLLTITCKASKRILLLAGIATWKAEEWAALILDALRKYEWGLPSGIISDRDARYMSQLWRKIFDKAGTKLMASTAYHPQTDGQSERTNQTVETAIRFAVTSFPDQEWSSFLPQIQSIMNNSNNATTGISPNMYVYGMNIALDGLQAVSRVVPKNLNETRNLYRAEAVDAMAFANTKAKLRHDKGHVHLKLDKGDFAFLNLHKGYRIPGDKNKFQVRRVGPFEVITKVGANAYELKIPDKWKIHPVISIQQLEPAPKGRDPYNRQEQRNPPAVEEKPPDGGDPIYELSHIVKKRYNRRAKKNEYLVRWLGWGPEHDSWLKEDDLQDARDLLQEFAKRSR